MSNSSTIGSTLLQPGVPIVLPSASNSQLTAADLERLQHHQPIESTVTTHNLPMDAQKASSPRIGAFLFGKFVPLNLLPTTIGQTVEFSVSNGEISAQLLVPNTTLPTPDSEGHEYKALLQAANLQPSDLSLLRTTLENLATPSNVRIPILTEETLLSIKQIEQNLANLLAPEGAPPESLLESPSQLAYLLQQALTPNTENSLHNDLLVNIKTLVEHSEQQQIASHILQHLEQLLAELPTETSELTTHDNNSGMRKFLNLLRELPGRALVTYKQLEGQLHDFVRNQLQAIEATVDPLHASLEAATNNSGLALLQETLQNAETLISRPGSILEQRFKSFVHELKLKVEQALTQNNDEQSAPIRTILREALVNLQDEFPTTAQPTLTPSPHQDSETLPPQSRHALKSIQAQIQTILSLPERNSLVDPLTLQAEIEQQRQQLLKTLHQVLKGGPSSTTTIDPPSQDFISTLTRQLQALPTQSGSHEQLFQVLTHATQGLSQLIGNDRTESAELSSKLTVAIRQILLDLEPPPADSPQPVSQLHNLFMLSTISRGNILEDVLGENSTSTHSPNLTNLQNMIAAFDRTSRSLPSELSDIAAAIKTAIGSPTNTQTPSSIAPALTRAHESLKGYLQQHSGQPTSLQQQSWQAAAILLERELRLVITPHQIEPVLLAEQAIDGSPLERLSQLMRNISSRAGEQIKNFEALLATFIKGHLSDPVIQELDLKTLLQFNPKQDNLQLLMKSIMNYRADAARQQTPATELFDRIIQQLQQRLVPYLGRDYSTTSGEIRELLERTLVDLSKLRLESNQTLTHQNQSTPIPRLPRRLRNTLRSIEDQIRGLLTPPTQPTTAGLATPGGERIQTLQQLSSLLSPLLNIDSQQLAIAQQPHLQQLQHQILQLLSDTKNATILNNNTLNMVQQIHQQLEHLLQILPDSIEKSGPHTGESLEVGMLRQLIETTIKNLTGDPHSNEPGLTELLQSAIQKLPFGIIDAATISNQPDTPLGQLLELLQQLINKTANSPGNTEQELRQLAGQLLETLTQDLPTGERRQQLQQAVEALRGQLDPQQLKSQDPRALQDTLQALRSLESIIVSHELLRQITPIMQTLGEPAMMMFPLLMQGFLSNLEATFYPPPKQDKSEAEHHKKNNPGGFERIQFRAELPHLGPVSVDLAHRKKELLIHFTFANEATSNFVKQHLSTLDERLRYLEYEQPELKVSYGTVKDPRPEWLLDLTRRKGVMA